MAASLLHFTAVDGTTVTQREIAIRQLIIAGWTGRDRAAMDKHIRELQELGVAPPASTPIYYRASASRLTFSDSIEVSGEETSGEVEFLLLRHAGTLFVGVGSDHTDRKTETYNVTVSKQVCDKPIAPVLWTFDSVRGHWDELVLRSWITVDGARVLYQEGPVTTLLAPEDLISKCTVDLDDGTLMFCGTLAARGGIRPADRFDFEIEDPKRGVAIRHGYQVMRLPVAG